MELITLSPLDLLLASGLIVLLGVLTTLMGLGVTRSLLVSSLRMVVQLLLVGLVLEALFAASAPLWIILMALVMGLMAGREVMARQKRRLRGWWGFGIGAAAMMLPAFSITLLAVTSIVRVEPWYEPQYAIPLLGMILGNTMNGIGIGLNQLLDGAWQRRGQIEARLMLGHGHAAAIQPLRMDAIRTGLIPVINMLTAAGVVSLPGMMTGQILSGTAPVEAVKYQIMIMFLIAAGTGLGTVMAVWLGSRRLFDERERLRLDRLR